MVSNFDVKYRLIFTTCREKVDLTAYTVWIRHSIIIFTPSHTEQNIQITLFQEKIKLFNSLPFNYSLFSVLEKFNLNI